MQATLMTRQPAPALARAGVRLRRCVRANAFGNALGGSIADQFSQGSDQQQRLADNRTLLNRANQQSDASYYGPTYDMGSGVGFNPARSGGLGLQLSAGAVGQWSDGVDAGIRQSARDLAWTDQSDAIQNRRLTEFTQERGNKALIAMRDADIDAAAAAQRAGLTALARQSAAQLATTGNMNYGNEGRSVSGVAPSWNMREASASVLAQQRQQADLAYQSRLDSGPQMRAWNPATDGIKEANNKALLNFLGGQGNMALGGIVASGAMLSSGNVQLASTVSDFVAPFDSLLAPMGGGASRLVSSARVRGVPSPMLPSEGNVGTYDRLINAGTKGDNVTPHHIPSARHMNQYGISKGDGIAINMEMPSPGVGGRHRDTFTYGSSADVNMSSRDALAVGIQDARSIYQRDGLYDSYVRQQLQDVVRQNKATYPQVFKKP